MTLAIHEALIGGIPCYGNPSEDCDGAEISAQSRHLATLLTISGAIDAHNVDALYQRGGCFVLSDTAFVLDLSGVTSFAAEGHTTGDAPATILVNFGTVGGGAQLGQKLRSFGTVAFTSPDGSVACTAEGLINLELIDSLSF